MDLWQELEYKRKELIDTITILAEYGRKKAQYEREYKVAYRKEVFRLNSDDRIAWTAAITMAHGDTDNFNVSTKRYNRDLAETLYQTTLEKVMAIKLEIRILENQLKLEWTEAGRNY